MYTYITRDGRGPSRLVCADHSSSWPWVNNIYIYIHTCIHIYTHTHTHTHIKMYTYITRGGEEAVPPCRCRSQLKLAVG